MPNSPLDYHKLTKVVVIEDDKSLLRELVNMLEELPQVELVNHYSDSVKFMAVLREQGAQFDVLITDIDMPGCNGLELAGQAKRPTIFVSAKTRDYIKDIEDIELSFDFEVIFVSKPVISRKLGHAINKCMSHHRIAESIKSGHVFAIKVEGQRNVREQIAFDQIRRISTYSQSGRNNCVCFLSQGPPKILLDYPIKDIVKLLPACDFCQISQSDIIHRAAFVRSEGNFISLDYQNDKEFGIPTNLNLSKNYKEAFNKWLSH